MKADFLVLRSQHVDLSLSLVEWMPLWDNTFRSWLALIITHGANGLLPNTDNHHRLDALDIGKNIYWGKVILDKEKTLGSMTLATNHLEYYNYTPIQWVWHLVENLKLDQVQITSVLHNQNQHQANQPRLGYYTNADVVFEEVEKASQFDPISELSPYVRLFWILAAMNHDCHHTLLQTPNFIPLTEWAKHRSGWGSRLHPLAVITVRFIAFSMIPTQ